MSEGKQIDSHIQITKGLLKNFSFEDVVDNNGKKNKTRFAYYYDITSNKVKCESIKELGTELGYFNKEMEKFLSDNIESKIGGISSKVKKSNKDSNVIIDKNDMAYAHQFMLFSVVRSEMMRKINNGFLVGNKCELLRYCSKNYGYKLLLNYIDMGGSMKELLSDSEIDDDINLIEEK